ncbi:nucleoside deaminase [Fodinibius sp. SL11]|uniref:nucleoside deaminase n=1 Tax=Fodinibius sp. SL11 TaxID=3425690 RepID=UPI003F8815C8
MVTESDLDYLRRCIALASKAVEAGDEAFGSVLVSGDNEVLFEDRNRINTKGDPTRHPEIEIAQWAAQNLNSQERDSATVYTSGEHCPMCAAAHGWVGLGRIVFISSSNQLTKWLKVFNKDSSPVKPISINEIVPNVEVEGPVPELVNEIKELHRKYHGQ